MDAGIDLFPFTGHSEMETLFPFTGHSEMAATDDVETGVLESAFEGENQRLQRPGLVVVEGSASPRCTNTGQPDAVADVAVGCGGMAPLLLLSLDVMMQVCEDGSGR